MTITRDGFIEVEITDDMMERAKAKADEMGELRNSIRRGKGNLCGFLGEEVVLAAWQGATSHNTFQHDIEFEGVTFESKAKDRTVPPSIRYEASVANYNASQRADFYVFVSLYRPNREDPEGYTKGFVIGIMNKEEYKSKAKFLKVGDTDPSNGWKVSADCFNLPYDELYRFDDWR